MNRTSTHKKNAKTNRLSLHRGILLSVICLLLPGCINNETSDRNPIETGMQRMANHFSKTAARNQEGPLSVNENDRTEDAENQTTNKNKVNDKPTESTRQANNPNPNTPVSFESHIDMHDKGEEENVLHIKFPALMRVVIMLLLVVLII
jgi:hypothetical protein